MMRKETQKYSEMERHRETWRRKNREEKRQGDGEMRRKQGDRQIYEKQQRGRGTERW